MFDLALYPFSISPVEERAIAIESQLMDDYALGLAGVDNPFGDYGVGYAGYRPTIGSLQGFLGGGLSTDGRGLMGVLGADYPLTDNLGLSYRHYSSPNHSNDGSDFLGLRYAFGNNNQESQAAEELRERLERRRGLMDIEDE